MSAPETEEVRRDQGRDVREALEESLCALLQHGEVRPVRWWEFGLTIADVMHEAQRLRDVRRAPVSVRLRPADATIVFRRDR